MKTIATTFAALLALTGAAAETHTVTFRRMNGTVLSRVQVAHGEPAPVPQAPDESGYTFKGWDNTNKVLSVTQDISCWALYEKGGYNEIDVFEQLCGSDWIGGTLHVGRNGSITSSNHTAPEDGVRFRDGFHRIGAIVTDRELVWYVDDHIFKRMDITESPWNRTQTTAKCLLLCSGICAGGGWLDNLGPELKCATAADITDDFMVDDYEIDYMRIYTNTNAGNTVAYDAPPAAAKLSAPVRATVWRGYDMRYGRTGQDFTANVNTGYEVGYYVNTALRQHFERDKADVVAFLSPTAYATANVSATAAIPADLEIPYKNRTASKPHRPGALQATVLFDELP